MIEAYPVMLDSKEIGIMEVEKKGLYYCFSCKCSLPGDGIYTIVASCGEQMQSLGVCVPVGSFFGLTKKIPLKNFSGSAMSFAAVAKDTTNNTIFVPLCCSEPFEYIRDLERAYFKKDSIQSGVRIRFENCCPSEADPGC